MEQDNNRGEKECIGWFGGELEELDDWKRQKGVGFNSTMHLTISCKDSEQHRCCTLGPHQLRMTADEKGLEVLAGHRTSVSHQHDLALRKAGVCCGR